MFIITIFSMIQFPYNKYNGHLKSAGRFIIERTQTLKHNKSEFLLNLLLG